MSIRNDICLYALRSTLYALRSTLYASTPLRLYSHTTTCTTYLHIQCLHYCTTLLYYTNSLDHTSIQFLTALPRLRVCIIRILLVLYTVLCIKKIKNTKFRILLNETDVYLNLNSHTICMGIFLWGIPIQNTWDYYDSTFIWLELASFGAPRKSASFQR